MRAVTVALLLGVARGQQVLNGDFEADVVDAYSYMTPTGWVASGGVVSLQTMPRPRPSRAPLAL